MTEHKTIVENYAGAILIAYRLYDTFVAEVDFNTFENEISNRYGEISFAVKLAIKEKQNDRT